MAGSAAVLTDQSTLSRIDVALERLERFMAFLSGLAVFAIMLFAVVSVTGRNFFNAPVPGYVDWIMQLMPVIAFLGISWAQRDGSHIRMDIFIGRLSGRVLWATEWITTLFTLFLIICLVWGSWAHFQRSFDFSAPLWSRDSTIDIGLPLWPAKLLAPISFFVLALRLVIQLIGFGRAFRTDDPHPVAVPLIRSMEEQAAEEAERLDDGGMQI